MDAIQLQLVKIHHTIESQDPHNPAFRIIDIDRALACVQATKGARAYEKAEDPIYALENNLPIDFQHYLEHHISQPILRIFEPMMTNPKDLLSGIPHEAKIHPEKPSTFHPMSIVDNCCKLRLQSCALGPRTAGCNSLAGLTSG